MRTRLPLLALALLLAPPLAAAEEEDYYVKPERHNMALPGDHGPGYDCAGDAGPHGAVESVNYDVDALSDGERWGLPYVAPGCLAFDETVQTPATGTGKAGRGGFPCPEDALPATWRLSCLWVSHASRTDATTPAGRLVQGPLGGPVGVESHARVTYNLTSGRYYVGLDTTLSGLVGAPRFPGSVEVMGDTGLSILFDCRECSPPW